MWERSESYVLDSRCAEESEAGVWKTMSAMDRYFTKEVAAKALADLRDARARGFGGSEYPYVSAGRREVWVHWDKSGEIFVRWWISLPDDENGVTEALLSLEKVAGAKARLLGGDGTWHEIAVVKKGLANTLRRLSSQG